MEHLHNKSVKHIDKVDFLQTMFLIKKLNHNDLPVLCFKNFNYTGNCENLKISQIKYQLFDYKSNNLNIKIMKQIFTGRFFEFQG